jgi:hypothetical protein
MKVRANGLSLPDLDTLAALETGRYWTPAKRPGEPLYRPAINNGYWAEDIITDGLRLYVPLWLYSGAKFPSVDAYHHTCTKTGVTWGLQGGTFNGTSDYVSLTNSIFDFAAEDFAIELWLRLSAIDRWHGVVRHGTMSSAGYSLHIISVNQLAFYTSQSGATQYTISAETYAANILYHVFVLRVGSTVRLFRNGVEHTYSATGVHIDPATTIAALEIGRNPSWGSDTYGLIGEVRLYNRALSLAEIQQNYNATRWRYA